MHEHQPPQNIDLTMHQLFLDSLLIEWNLNTDYAAKLVADLTPEQMVHQPGTDAGPGLNHPAWVLSHLHAYHPVIVALLQGESFEDPKHHKFGMLSKPEPDASVYPAKDELVSAYAAGRASVVEALLEVSAETLEAPMPLERWVGKFPRRGSILPYLMAHHESLHLGQLSAWRRVQGLPAV
ncbi:MAG: DinB family protein [Planctomycetota bacterium]